MDTHGVLLLNTCMRVFRVAVALFGLAQSSHEVAYNTL